MKIVMFFISLQDFEQFNIMRTSTIPEVPDSDLHMKLNTNSDVMSADLGNEENSGDLDEDCGCSGE